MHGLANGDWTIHVPSTTGQHVAGIFWVFTLTQLLSHLHCKHVSGCTGRQRRGLHRHDDIAACKGTWKGHVNEGGVLCASGWAVCSWRDRERLGTITWDEAMSVHGCYVYNAEQMHGQCVECSLNSITGSLAGIGRGCSHHERGGVSCIIGGVIDAGVVSHGLAACSYDARSMDGVLCCRLPQEKPKITVKPPPNLQTYSGIIFLLPCQATGSPKPHIFWYKDGHALLGNGSRVSVLDSGDLLVSLSQRSDSGIYTCEAVNKQGISLANSAVTVSDRESGCMDQTTEGLFIHSNVHACAGRWRGHVKRAWRLCARGWGVCNPRDQRTLSEIGWDEVRSLDGCYAYNAANTWGRCTKCSRRKMAGIGHKCGRLRLHKTSCLAQGRVDVYWPKQRTSCNYRAGLTSGVLCCRKRRRKSLRNNESGQKCRPYCANGGMCVGTNQCHCLHGYKGTHCQIPICVPACGYGRECVRPNKCRCSRSKAGRSCRSVARLKCRPACRNNGRCVRGRCRCRTNHWGRRCQHLRMPGLTVTNSAER